MPRGADPIADARALWRAHGWDGAADGMAAVTSVMRAQQILQARVDRALRPHDLTFARYELLMLLVFSRHGSLPLSIVTTRLQVHPTSVTNAVSRLVAAGLVVRVQHPTDGRAALVEITASGRATALAATTTLNEAVFSRPGLSARRTGTLISVLEELRGGAGDFAP